MSEALHKRIRRGSVIKEGRFPPPPPAPPAPALPEPPMKRRSSSGLPFEFRRGGGGDKENAPPEGGGANGGGGGGGMGLLIPMLGREDGPLPKPPPAAGGRPAPPPPAAPEISSPPKFGRADRPRPSAAAASASASPVSPRSAGGGRRAPRRDSASSAMSLCFDGAEEESDGAGGGGGGGGAGRGGGGGSPPPRVPSIPPRLGSPPKVTLARRPVKITGLKRRNITPPAPLFPHEEEAAEGGGDAFSSAAAGGGGSPRKSPPKASRIKSSFFAAAAAAGGAGLSFAPPGLTSLFGEEMDDDDDGDGGSPECGGREPPTPRRPSPQASPRKLPFSLASSSTPRTSPKPPDLSDPHGGARGMFQSPHWSSAVHINPFSPVPTEYLAPGAAAAWARPGEAAEAGGAFYSARGSPLRSRPSRPSAGAAAAARAAASASVARRRGRTPRRQLRTMNSCPLPQSENSPGGGGGRPRSGESAKSAGSAGSACASDASMDRGGGGGDAGSSFYGGRPSFGFEGCFREGRPSGLAVDTSAAALDSDGDEQKQRGGSDGSDAEISPTDVLSFPPPPTPAKKTPRRAAPPVFASSPPRDGGGGFASSPVSGDDPFRERRPPPLNRIGPGRSFDVDDDLEDMVGSPRVRDRRGSLQHRTAAVCCEGYHHHRRQSSLPQCALPQRSRFEQDFQVVGTLGTGSFGTVHKVISRLDGCLYAVKVMKRPVRGELDRRQTLKEVHALAALCSQADASAFHIVRYHQAWMEDNLLHIQTELCTSTLPHEMAAGMLIDEDRRFKLLREMLLALGLIHKNEMVHLDIKPENIFIKNDQFKLGDFGLASKLTSGSDVEEGDSRYMSRELLSVPADGARADLTKCDVFSLGATMYEICLGRTLPADGPEWIDVRSGRLERLRRTHPALEGMIAEMMRPDPTERPCASGLLTRRELLSEEQKLLRLEQMRAREASLALAAHEERIRRMYGEGRPTKKMMRSASCQLY